MTTGSDINVFLTLVIATNIYFLTERGPAASKYVGQWNIFVFPSFFVYHSVLSTVYNLKLIYVLKTFLI